MKRIDEIIETISTARSWKESEITLDDVKLVIDELSSNGNAANPSNEINELKEENERLKEKIERLSESNKQLIAEKKKMKGTTK